MKINSVSIDISDRSCYIFLWGWVPMKTVSRGIFVAFAVLLIILTGCPTPVGPNDSAARAYDTDPPGEPATGNAPLTDPYDTQPQWTWSTSGGGSEFFRVRVNGSEWEVGVTPPYPNPPKDFYPGTYLFEVQERDSAGNWSETTTQTTEIKVREPAFTAAVTGDTNDSTPSFSWTPYAPPQYGASGRYFLQLESDAGGAWEAVASESVEDTTLLSYTISAPLTDGQYRFGVAEWNDGGSRSDLVYSIFRVDTIPPPPPTVSSTDLVYGLLDSPAFSFSSNDSNSIGFTWRIVRGTLPTDTEVASSGATPSASTSYVSTPLGTEAIYTIFVTDYDTAGNVSSPGSLTFAVEDIPTVTTNFSPAGSVTNDDPALFDVLPSGVATSTQYQYRINGGAWTPVVGNASALWQLSLPLPSDGVYVIEVRQELTPASGGYTSPSVDLGFTADTTPPATPSIVSSIPAYNNTGTISFTVSGEPFATFPIDVTGGVTGQSLWSVTDSDGNGSETFSQFFPDDDYTITVDQSDLAGNLSVGSATASTIVDTTPPIAPTITFTDPPDSVHTATNSVTITATIEPGSTLLWTQSGANNSSGSQPDVASDGTETLNFTGLSDGTTDIVISSQDAAGNIGTTAFYTAILDTTPPAALVFDGGNPTVTNDSQPTLTFTNPEGLTVDYSLIDVGLGTPVPGETGSSVGMFAYTVGAVFALDGSDDGDYRLEVFGTDLAGNVSPTSSWTFTLDTQAPAAPTSVTSTDLQGPPGGYYVTTATPAFTWGGSGEPGASFVYSVDGGVTTVGSAVSGAPITALGVALGYDFRVQEIDAAGNASIWSTGVVFDVISSGSGTITITNPADPTFTFSPSGGFALNRDLAATMPITVTATGVTVDSYTWLINGVNQGVNSDSFVVDSTDGDVYLGVNTVTLVVDVGGTPYSEDFFFTVVE